MITAPFRLLRSGSLAVSIVGLASVAHISGGGALPAPAIMLALVALNVLASTVATRFKLGAGAMLAILGSSQVALHQVFETLSQGSGANVPSSVMAGMSHHMPADFPLLPSGASMSSMAGAAMTGHQHMSSIMMAAHVGATVVTALILFKGEAALWALARWLRPVFTLVKPSTILAVAPVRQSQSLILPRRNAWDGSRPHSRRGPPLEDAVFA